MSETAANPSSSPDLLHEFVRLSDRVARLEAQAELHAPFLWVHELVDGFRQSLADMREAMAVLPREDEHLAERMKTMAERFDESLEQIEKRMKSEAAVLASNNAELLKKVETIGTDVANIKDAWATRDKASLILKKPQFAEVVSWCKGIGVIGSTVGLAFYVFFQWLRPILQFVWEMIEHAVKTS